MSLRHDPKNEHTQHAIRPTFRSAYSVAQRLQIKGIYEGDKQCQR